MDERLKAALDKGKQARDAGARAEKAVAKAKEDKHKAEIEAQMPKARRWLNENLFDLIARAEASPSPYRRIGLSNSYGVSAEALFQAAKEIEGINPEFRWHCSDPDPESWSNEGYYEYWIEWGTK